MTEQDLPGLTESVAEAIGTVYGAAMAWILGYWIRELGRRPGPDSWNAPGRGAGGHRSSRV
ncbi:hypothetical protein [Kitasatospora sp. NPDC097643]|uniref:hypothetical protein n=1 Tax=Kitasatospora sp. NPDC097643 TaxID=3157230 RepID=UPI0033277EE4